MAVNTRSIIADIESGKFAPLYFLQGEEPFDIDRISDLIPNKALNEGERAFNLTVLFGRDVDMLTVLNHARRFPMMAARQVVIVKEAQQITDIGKDSGKKSLEHYCNNIVPTTVLVFCHKNKNLDKRTTLAKIIAKSGVMLSTKKLYENQVPDWINEYVGGKGARINQKANLLLTEYIGNNLQRLSNEIDKILINKTGENLTINEDHIHEFVGINKEFNVFELQKAILMRDRLKVFQIVNYFGANQKTNPPVLLMYQLYGLFSKLLMASDTPVSSKGELASILGVNPYFVSDYMVGLNNYTIEERQQALHHLHEADARLKGVGAGAMTSVEIMNELMYKLLRQ